MEIYTKAAQSIGRALTPAVPFEAQLTLNVRGQIETMLKETDEAIEKVCKGFAEYPCLLSIPGFGPDVSAKVLGAIGNPYRFDNGRQVLKMAGLDLSGDRSGKRDATPMVISKKGKAWVKLGYQYYKFEYTGSNNWVGAPIKIADILPSTMQMLTPLKNAQNFYATFEVKF